MAIAMMVVSDYKLRLRAPGASLSGRADVAVMAELGVYGLVAVFLFFQLGRPPTLRRAPTLLTLAWVFALCLVLSAFWGVYPLLGLVRGAQLLVTCGLAHAIALFATRDHLRHLVHAFVGLVAASAAFGVVRPFPKAELQAGRFNWLYVHPVMAATYLGLAAVLLLGLLVAGRQRRRSPTWPGWVYLALFLLTAGALVATRTRGGLAAFVVGGFVVTISSVQRKSRLDILVLSVVVGTIAAIIAAEDILVFLARGESSESLRTLTSRTVLWEEAFALFRDRPVFGYGLTASRGLFFDSVGLGGAHNAFINVLVDAGALGAVAFVALLAVLIRSARSVRWARSVGQDVPMILGAITFLLCNSATAEYAATPGNVANLWLFILVGWVLALRRLHDEAGAGPPRPAVALREPPVETALP